MTHSKSRTLVKSYLNEKYPGWNNDWPNHPMPSRVQMFIEYEMAKDLIKDLQELGYKQGPDFLMKEMTVEKGRFTTQFYGYELRTKSMEMRNNEQVKILVSEMM